MPSQGITSDRIEGNFRTTHMARTTHIAVNLLLIVAVTMQPGLAYALGQHCSAGVSTGFTCQGCGCCKVQSETAKCPCCNSEASDKEDGCCGHVRQHEDRVATFANDPFAGMELEEGSVPDESEQPRDDNQPHIQAADTLSLAAACDCVTAPEPFDAPAPRSATIELRDVITVSVAHCDATTAERPPLASLFDVAHRPITLHFSQIVFCVWRL